MAVLFQNSSLAARCGLAALSGIAYALAFPPLGWRWLIVPGLAGLFLAIQGLRQARARGVGFLHGMVAFGVGLPWLWLLFGAFSIALWMILAAFTAAFAWLQGRAEERGIAGWKWLAFALLNWGGWEFIRAELFLLRFPWMTPGLAMGPNALLPWIGVYGTGLLMVLLGASLAQRRWVAAAIALALAGALSITSIQGEPAPVEEGQGVIRVAGLQYENVSFAHLVAATKELPSDVKHVVWPEYSVPFDVRAQPRDWATLQNLCREREITLTIGTRTQAKNLAGWHNTALTLDASGARGEHYKVRTVHFFDDGISGSSAHPVETAHGKVGTPICFDCDYEGIVRRMTAAGAEAFMVPMMDAESWSKWQHVQHAELFRIRACENGRWLFVCGSSGVSQLIDPQGKVHARMAAMEQGPLTGWVRRETQLTFYTRRGWLTPWCVLGAATLCWIALLMPRRAAKDIPS